TIRNFSSPTPLFHDAGLQAAALTMSNTSNLLDFVELNYGAEFQAITFMGQATAFRPFAALGMHLGPNTLLQYRYTTSRPTTRMSKGFDSAPADLSESDPRLSVVNSGAHLEKARHQELSIARRLGPNTTLEFAGYTDRVSNLALTGVGDFSNAIPTDIL